MAHRDISPADILVFKNTNNGRVFYKFSSFEVF